VSRAGPEETKTTTLQQRLESAKVLREFNTEGAEVHQFKTAKDLVVFLLWKTDSSVVVAYGLDGTRRFRFGLPDTGFRRLLWFDVSDDGSTLVIAEVLAFESVNMRVFDIGGALRFSLHTEVEILSSPSGTFFSNRDVDPSPEVLTIYDSLGGRIRSLARFHAWNCRFIDNERLFVARGDTARLVDVRNGQVTRSISLDALRSWTGPPGICLSRSRSLIAVYNSGGTAGAVQLFTASGDLKWTASYPDRLCTVAIDDRDEWMALQFGNPGSRSGFVRIVSVSDPAIIYQSEGIDALGSTVFGGHVESSWFSGGLVTIAAPPRAGPLIDRNAPAVTVFLAFDVGTRTIGSSTTLPGLYRPARDLPSGSQLVRVRPGSPAALISMPAEER
jgi:hypothetical protein